MNMFALALLLIGCSLDSQQDSWDKVWKAIYPPAKAQSDVVPNEVRQAGSPIKIGNQVFFRYLPPPGTRRVYLAGNFNGFADNSNGKVSDLKYSMRQGGGAIWWTGVKAKGGEFRYKYVVENSQGDQIWVSDPNVSTIDKDQNSVLDLANLEPRRSSHSSTQWPTPLRPLTIAHRQKVPTFAVRSEKVWFLPGERNQVEVELTQDLLVDAKLKLTVLDPFGTVIATAETKPKAGRNAIPVGDVLRPGGYIARVELVRGGKAVAQGETILTVAKNIADDLRYGFFATYSNHGGDYSVKARMLADLGVNAVEYYDYFPAHGLYAPTTERYLSEPFHVSIDARDVQHKIDAGHKANILSLAYVAAYAASESIYRAHPDPMTDDRGVPKIFNGAIMPEDKADLEHKPKWFWLMNVSPGSSWNQYVMKQFASALEGNKGSLVSFDGFEVDTYGDSSQTRFYAKGSPRTGDLLKSVLHDFVGDVRSLTHRIKPNGLVSFNSVNEFGIEEMVDATDFLFMEIWRGHTDRLDGLTDIAYARRSRLNQRVVLKVYPADMEPGRSTWTPHSLRRTMGAVMTGGGTLMVAGEPDEKTGTMHALQSLYYPDHKPISTELNSILRAYNRHDALLFGLTHGKDVFNVESEIALDGCFVRAFGSPSQRTITYQILRTGKEGRWPVEIVPDRPVENFEAVLDLPAGIPPKSVWYSTPDSTGLADLLKLDFQVQDSKLRTLIPELNVHGTLVLKY